MNRSDVFISYRRTEKEITRTLDQALKYEGMEVWVDWEDIPPGAPNFTEEIQIGIEGADVFVAVISADYTESKYCMMELDEALKLNKRVIPIILEKFDRSALPREVRDINWVYIYRNEDGSYPFEENFPTLLEAITADREHIATHTRYLLRAMEWDGKSRNTSFLLTGSELEEAERWLATAGKKEPLPTAIHGEYIYASRARQRSQQRRLLILVTLAFLFSIALTIFSVLQYLDANEQRASADASRSQAQSLLWSNYALGAIADDNTRLALPLALAANQIGNPPAFSQQALAQAAYAPGPRRVFTVGTGDRVWTTAYRQDEGQIVGGTSSGELILWDITDAERRLWTAEAHAGSVWSVAVLPEDERMISAGADGRVRMWNGNTGAEVAEFEGHDTTIWSLAVTDNGRYVAGGGIDGAVYVWELRGEQVPELVVQLSGNSEVMWTVSFSETGRYLAAGGSSGIVTIWEVPEFEELRRFEGHVGAVWATDFSPNEDFLITGGDDAQVLRWDINSGAIAKRYRAHRDRVLSVAYLADGRELLSSSADGRIILWDANTALQREQYDGHEGAVWEVHPSGVAEQFISSSADGTAILWDETNGARLGDLASRQGAITTATYSPDGQFVAYGTTNRYIVQRSVTSSETLTFSPRAHTDVINDLAYSPDGQLLASAADNRVILWDAFFGAPRGQLDGHTDEVRSVMFDPVEPYLYSTGNDGRVIIWNYNTRELLFQFRTHDATVWDVAVGAGNEEMATVSSDRSVRLWENPIAEEDMDEEVEEPEEIELHTDVVRAAVYSPDGKWLATGGDDNTIFLHNIFSEENVLERRLNGHEYPVTSIAYSTDGQYLVSGDTSGTVIIWTSDGDAIRIYDAHRDEVTDVQFEPTGQPVVMSSSLDGLVIFWRADSPGDLRDWTIANRDVRELTCPEKEFYQQELDEDCIAELESGAIEPPEVQPTDAEQVARNEENTSE